jgi:nitrite reductase (NADH) large subunit
MKRSIPIVVARDGATAAAAAAATAAPDTDERFFANYTQLSSRVPAAAWWSMRAAVLLGTLALAALLAWQPSRGLQVLWGLAVPLLPAVLVLAPGLWRQVCPMALLNQLPRSLGRGPVRELPDVWKRRSFAIAVALFIGAVALRPVLLNHSAPAALALVLGALALAAAGGLVFKGRSGWCGTFCPLGPIQRTYGQAPLVVVRNGYCEPCVGCQKNCYDFNPRAAVFSDIEDDDPRHAGQRRLFMGLLPGLLLGYFVPPALGVPPGWHSVVWLLLGAAASAGLYGLLVAYLPLGAYRVALGFGALAIATFYFFAAPLMLSTLGKLTSIELPVLVLSVAPVSGVLLALALAWSGLRSERRWRAVNDSRRAAKVPKPAPAEEPKTRFGGGRSLKDRLQRSGAVEITDRETGIAFEPAPDGTLLEAIEKAGLKINYGCRAGVCGADPVVVCEGAEHLSPPGEGELATLRRLGLEGRARLACAP